MEGRQPGSGSPRGLHIPANRPEVCISKCFQIYLPQLIVKPAAHLIKLHDAVKPAQIPPRICLTRMLLLTSFYSIPFIRFSRLQSLAAASGNGSPAATDRSPRGIHHIPENPREAWFSGSFPTSPNPTHCHAGRLRDQITQRIQARPRTSTDVLDSHIVVLSSYSKYWLRNIGCSKLLFQDTRLWNLESDRQVTFQYVIAKAGTSQFTLRYIFRFVLSDKRSGAHCRGLDRLVFRSTFVVY